MSVFPVTAASSSQIRRRGAVSEGANQCRKAIIPNKVEDAGAAAFEIAADEEFVDGMENGGAQGAEAGLVVVRSFPLTDW